MRAPSLNRHGGGQLAVVAVTLTAALAIMFVLAMAFAMADAAQAAPASGPPNFTGVWQVEHFTPAIRTSDGKLPPLKPEALALYKQRVADRAAGKPVNDPIDACLPHGAVRLMFAPYPMLILQGSNGQVDVIQEANHTTRLFYIGQKPADPDDPKWLGQSVAHWEGRTLVASTNNNDERTWLDKAGLPHSDAMIVTERLALGPGGKTLSDTITVDDPKTYTAPWTTVVHLRRKPGPMTLEPRSCFLDHKM